MVDFGQLYPDFAAQVQLLRNALGPQWIVDQTYRSVAQQDFLYAQGRTRPGLIITNARGGQSAHNFGLAVDFVLMLGGAADWVNSDYDALGAVVSTFPLLRWGGTFVNFPDRPHVEWAPGGPWTAAALAPLAAAARAGGLSAAWSML